MSVYKIQITLSLYQSLNLKNATFFKRDDAINSVKKALDRTKTEHTTEEASDGFVFINSTGAELAKIIEE